ncbi:hypothetical protein ACFLQ1_02375, partial [Candidatus Auribacterota bacterium]
MPLEDLKKIYSLKKIIKNVLLLGIIFFVLANNNSYAQKIYSLEERDAEFISWSGTQNFNPSQPGKHYFIRFEKDESFEFVIPEAHALVRPNLPFYSEGVTICWVDNVIPFPVSNRVLLCRNALLAARNYYNQVCADSGLTQTWWEDPAVPIQVLFGVPNLSRATACAGFWKHQIIMRPNLIPTAAITGTACHEYFHLVYDAVWYNGDENDFWLRYKQNSRQPFKEHMLDMTAEYSIDEPIMVRLLNGTDCNQDTLNQYVHARNSFAWGFFNNNKLDLLERNRYRSCLFIKFLSEQIARPGGADTSTVAEILKMVEKIYREAGGVNHRTFYKAIAEALPTEQWGNNWERAWQKFYTAFAATTIVQSAACNNDRNIPLGFHDDAFINNPRAYLTNYDLFKPDQYKRLPTRVYKEEATSNEERKDRLKTLCNGSEAVNIGAYHFKAIYENQRWAGPERPIFVYARAEKGADVFLLHHKMPHNQSHFDRTQARFSKIMDFTLLDQPDDQWQSDIGIIEEFSGESEKQMAWVGLVNAKAYASPNVMSWSYLISPRIMPLPNLRTRHGSDKVHLIDGSARIRGANEGFYNGDTFTLEIVTTARIDRRGAPPADIPVQDIALEVKILNEHDREVQLEIQNNKELTIKRLRHRGGINNHHHRYSIKGKFDEHNPITGDCRFKIKISSPLNLGLNDYEIDESFTFTLRPKHPVVEHVDIFAGQTKIYENYKIFTTPEPAGDTYNLDFTCSFDMPMKPNTVVITAGSSSPYNTYNIQNLTHESDIAFSGTFSIPKSDVPAQGMVLYFSIAGESKASGFIDTDITLAGNQPDTSYFILLGIKDFWDLKLISKAKETISGDPSTGLKRYGKASFGPLEINMRFVPDRRYTRGEPNAYVRNVRGDLTYIKKTITHLDTWTA